MEFNKDLLKRIRTIKKASAQKLHGCFFFVERQRYSSVKSSIWSMIS